MKKTLLSVLAGVAVITSASAGIKETCLQNPDKLVWLEKDNTCIPVHPCENEKYSAYCDKIFAHSYIEDWQTADSYASLRLCYKYGECPDSKRHSIKEADNGVNCRVVAIWISCLPKNSLLMTKQTLFKNMIVKWQFFMRMR